MAGQGVAASPARVAGLVAVFMALWVSSLLAQQGPRMLTLEEAVALARRNNPTFLSRENDQSAADWGVRSAYSAFLPTVTASAGGGYQAKGEVRFGTITLDNQSTDWLSSNYRIGFNGSNALNKLYSRTKPNNVVAQGKQYYSLSSILAASPLASAIIFFALTLASSMMSSAFSFVLSAFSRIKVLVSSPVCGA